MRIAIACDHAGFPLKAAVTEVVNSVGHQVFDFGTDSTEPVDYPDVVERACRALQKSEVDRAIILCGSGIGAAIAANKLKGVYACVCHDSYSAAQGVEHDNMNTLSLGARVIGVEVARACVLAFLGAEFSTEERHRRRVYKIRILEQEG
jgi:ribose 5-phosphate isomerase B